MYVDFGFSFSRKRKMHMVYSRIPQIGDVDERIVKACKDSSNAKHQLTYTSISMSIHEVGEEGLGKGRTITDLRSKRDVLLRRALDLLLRRHTI